MKGSNRNSRAIKMIALALSALVYVGSVIYGDLMFLQVMSVVFPTGFLGTLAMAGAVMTAASAIILPLALHYWFSPGLQFLWGIGFWIADIVALGLNSILAYALATGGTQDAFILGWASISPATPLLAVIGWGIAYLLDDSHKLRHAEAELESDELDIYASRMREAAKSDEVYQVIEDAAKKRAAEYAGNMHEVKPVYQAPTRPPVIHNSESVELVQPDGSRPNAGKRQV